MLFLSTGMTVGRARICKEEGRSAKRRQVERKDSCTHDNDESGP